MKKVLLCVAVMLALVSGPAVCFAGTVQEVVATRDFTTFFARFITLDKSDQIACMRFPFTLKKSDSMVDVDSQVFSLAGAKQVLADDIGKPRQIIGAKPPKGCEYTAKSTGPNTWDAYLSQGTAVWTAYRFMWDGSRWWFYEMSL